MAFIASPFANIKFLSARFPFYSDSTFCLVVILKEKGIDSQYPLG